LLWFNFYQFRHFRPKLSQHFGAQTSCGAHFFVSHRSLATSIVAMHHKKHRRPIRRSLQSWEKTFMILAPGAQRHTSSPMPSTRQ
jgi:hypothetical protein